MPAIFEMSAFSNLDLLNFVRSTHKREFNEHFETVFLRSHKTDFFNMIISKWRIIDTDLYWQSPKRQQILWILTKTQWDSVCFGRMTFPWNSSLAMEGNTLWFTQIALQNVPEVLGATLGCNMLQHFRNIAFPLNLLQLEAFIQSGNCWLRSGYFK